MKHHRFGTRSHHHLALVHPHLVTVAEAALKRSRYDFGITCGLREMEEQKKLLAEGKTQTLMSKHLEQKDGFAHAIDFMVYINGKETWEAKYYRKVMQAFVTAAIDLGVQIELGGLWESFIDSPHVQLKSI